MKRFSFLFVLLLSVLLLGCTSVNYPSYEEIVTHFYSNYGLQEGYSNIQIRFVKHPDGYYVEEMQGAGGFENRQLLWSGKTNQFLSVEFGSRNNKSRQLIERTLKAWDAYLYDLYPYYGYLNWEDDVIRVLSNKKILSDDDLYALGRAYSTAATDLLNNNSGFGNNSESFELSESGENQLGKKQLEMYRRYSHKAIEQYKNLCAKTPDYETIVGTICTKTSNEYMASFLNILVYQNEEEALKELTEQLYDPIHLDIAKNYLNSCEPNAILFTHGDNDTYPLLYVQAKEDFRSDVLVVNTSLLNSNTHANFYRDRTIFKSTPAQMTLSKETYTGDHLGWTFCERTGKIYADLPDIFKLINDKQSQIYSNEQYPGIPFLPTNKFNVVLDSGESMSFKINKNTLYRGELLALDIIQTNISTRPVYILNNTILPIEEYTELNGFAYKFVPQKASVKGALTKGSFNEEQTFRLIMEDLHHTINEAPPKLILFPYLRAFAESADYYFRTAQKEKCKEVINRYFKLFPETEFGLSYSLMPMLKAAYGVGLTDEGNMILSYIIELINEKLTSGDFEQQDINISHYLVLELIQEANKYNNSSLDNLEKLRIELSELDKSFK